MIIDLSPKDHELIRKIENIFIKENHIINIVNDFNNNPYIKYIIYSINSDIVGYLSYYDIYDRYEIDNIFVLSNYRNMGIGSKLLKELFTRGYSSKIKNITLEVNVNNKIAIKLYKDNGFIEVAKREKYYSSDDGILMEKEMI